MPGVGATPSPSPWPRSHLLFGFQGGNQAPLWSQFSWGAACLHALPQAPHPTSAPSALQEGKRDEGREAHCELGFARSSAGAMGFFWSLYSHVGILKHNHGYFRTQKAKLLLQQHKAHIKSIALLHYISGYTWNQVGTRLQYTGPLILNPAL